MNQHGAPSAASPHRLTPQSLPKQQHRVNNGCGAGLRKTIQVRLTSKVF